VLQTSDLPADADASPADESDPTTSTQQAKLVQCVGGQDTSADKVAEATSPDFGIDNGGVSSSAASFKSQSDLATDIALVQSPKLPACYEALLKDEAASQLPAGATIDAATFSISPGRNGGPSNIIGIGTGSVTVTIAGHPVSLYVAVAFITGRLTEAEVSYENPQTPVSISDILPLATAVAQRAAKL